VEIARALDPEPDHRHSDPRAFLDAYRAAGKSPGPTRLRCRRRCLVVVPALILAGILLLLLQRS
jgi:hypothetical protein